MIAGSRDGLAGTGLRDAAVAAVSRGWPVVPGTYPVGAGERWYGRVGATGLGPLEDAWEISPLIEWNQAHAVWAHYPYGVLLVCGQGVDVLELPTRLAEAALATLDVLGLTGPIAVLPPARWLVFAASGSGPLPRLAAWPSVVYRGPGCWAPLPPTDLGHAPARWHVAPEPGVSLPPSQELQHAVIDTLEGGGSWPAGSLR
jgi:hypothetical protein